MRRAILRLEDVGPGGSFGAEENLLKLQVIADYLHSENVPFHVSVIPRYINPSIRYDKSIGDDADPFILSFNRTIKYLQGQGGSIGMHGYTHQYGESISAVGHEFYHPRLPANCPPDDPKEACLNKEDFENSYASSRMRKGFELFAKAEIKIDWMSTPHYYSSPTQRSITEAWAGILFEDHPQKDSKTVFLQDNDYPFYRGAVYVPTPLSYLQGPDFNSDIKRICNEAEGYSPDQLAAFYYHPFRELPFIQISQSNGVTSIDYDDNSYLKKLIRGFKAQGFTFLSLLDQLSFVPSLRKTDFFSGSENIVLTGDINNDGKTELIVREESTGNWYGTTFNIPSILNRHCAGSSTQLLLSNWGKGNQFVPLVGDFNGDGFDDVVLWDPDNGNWQVALSNGIQICPDRGLRDNLWLKHWGIGKQWMPLVGDFDGDGKDDLILWDCQKGEWHVALSNGQGFAPSKQSWINLWGVGHSWTASVGDFNGDGKDDLVIWSRQYGEWRLALSDGRKFTRNNLPRIQSWTQRMDWYPGSQWDLLVGDVDGDGLDDLLIVNGARGEWRVVRSTGSDFIPLDQPFSSWSAGDDMHPLVGDFTGSGKVSLCARHLQLRNGTIDLAISVLGK